MPTGNGSGEWSAPSGKGDRGDRPQPPEGGSNFDPKGGPETGSAEATFWMLLGVSVLVLAGGIITAVKKKY